MSSLYISIVGEEREESEKRICENCLVNVNKEEFYAFCENDSAREGRHYIILCLEKNVKFLRRAGNLCGLLFDFSMSEILYISLQVCCLSLYVISILKK